MSETIHERITNVSVVLSQLGVSNHKSISSATNECIYQPINQSSNQYEIEFINQQVYERIRQLTIESINQRTKNMPVVANLLVVTNTESSTPTSTAPATQSNIQINNQFRNNLTN